MTFVTDKYSSPAEYLKLIGGAYDAKFKYLILGKEDQLFEKLARALPKERFDGLKRQRVFLATNLTKLVNAGDSESLKKAANFQTNYLRSVVADVKSIEKEEKASKIAFIISGIADEFKDAVERYVGAAGENPDLSKDKSFKAAAQLMYNKLRSIIAYQKIRLTHEHQYYNTSIVNATRKLDQIRDMLAAFTPGQAAAASGETVPAEESGEVDIVV